MSGYLLDTCAFIWALTDDPMLSRSARDIISDEAHALYLSPATAWEIAIKTRLGKMQAFAAMNMEVRFKEVFESFGYVEIPITTQHALLAGSLKNKHQDPFDRMLVAQAKLEGLTIITCDKLIQKCGVACLW